MTNVKNQTTIKCRWINIPAHFNQTKKQKSKLIKKNLIQKSLKFNEINKRPERIRKISAP